MAMSRGKWLFWRLMGKFVSDSISAGQKAPDGQGNRKMLWQRQAA